MFSEIYYPYGWEVKVNGEKIDLMRVNYVLRGLELKKGDNIIEMRFNPLPYSIGNKVVIASNFILLLLSISILFLEVRTKFKK